ncbi:hypothetical protein HAX54_019722 [Datura stramonium]|uniref:Strictosidine synthase conserved region domain-containing protein n=1 Tax=Datura stramonium TaxID=4076 RepID=A0ABS8US72_DATST|nr:hypothetical protein [Datura stramonium]
MNASNLLLISATAALAIFSVILAFDNENVLKPPRIPGSQNLLPKSEIIQLKGAVGPESIAFDPKGEGPYTGVADGRILGRQGSSWTDFAVTFSEEELYLALAPEMEHVCGRPLGLRFDTKTGELYIADAYFGPSCWTNRRTSYPISPKIRRLMKYDKSTKEVTVLLSGLAFANGVALSKDRSFVLVAETSTCRIMRYWLKGPHAGKHDTFAELPGFPDNIRINSKGEFWVALHAKRSVFAQLSISDSELGKALLKLPITAQQLDDLLGGGQPHATTIKLSYDGRVLEVLEDVEGKTLRSISEVEEKHGCCGSVLL